jgi:hypothetical protein
MASSSLTPLLVGHTLNLLAVGHHKNEPASAIGVVARFGQPSGCGSLHHQASRQLVQKAEMA